jgi:outer membrane receptor protein involved in Fe transport
MESLSTYYMRNGITEHYLDYPNRSLRFAKALHLVAGYENLLTRNLFLKTEIYYQYLYNIPVENSDTSSFSVLNMNTGTLDRALVNRGTGRNMGLEVTLEKYFSDNYYFLITTSLFDSKYRALDGVLRNTRYNTGYVINVLGGKDLILGKRAKRTLSLNLKGTWTGGQWHTPVDIEKSADEGTTVRDESRAFSEQWKGFLRIDFKVALTRNRRRATHTLELDIQNITNNLNVIGDYYDPYSGEVRTITQMGIVPIFNYRILF